ncbi:hypothetical protein Tco_1535611 [Tanacetum coccineum]
MKNKNVWDRGSPRVEFISIIPSPATTRSDDQIMLFNAWVSIGKGNHVLDLQKKQRNPIFISLWILCITQNSSELSLHQLMLLPALQRKLKQHLPPPPPPLQQSTVHRDIR